MTARSQQTMKPLILIIFLVVLVFATYFLFFAQVLVDCNCNGCEMACWSTPIKAILEGKKILGPYFIHPLLNK